MNLTSPDDVDDDVKDDARCGNTWPGTCSNGALRSVANRYQDVPAFCSTLRLIAGLCVCFRCWWPFGTKSPPFADLIHHPVIHEASSLNLQGGARCRHYAPRLRVALKYRRKSYFVLVSAARADRPPITMSQPILPRPQRAWAVSLRCEHAGRIVDFNSSSHFKPVSLLFRKLK